MKFSKPRQLALVSAAALGLATLLTACDSNTVDYLYVASAKAINGATNPNGQIAAYYVDSESGAIRQIPDSPFPSGGTGPSAMVVSQDYKNLYVANGVASTSGGNTIVRFAIGTDGKLYPQDTVTPPGSLPVSMSIDNNGQYLYVAQKYGNQSGCSQLDPCSGGVAVIPLASDGSFSQTNTSSLAFYPLTVSGSSDVITPTGIAALPVANSLGSSSTSSPAVYVTAYDYSVVNAGGSSASCPTVNGLAQCGYIFGYGANSGALTAQAITAAGVRPSAIAAAPTGNWVYATDYSAGQLLSFSVTSGSTLQAPNSPVKTGSQPSAIAIDPRGEFIYVANQLDSTVSGFAINTTNGVPTAVVASTTSSNATDSQPVAITVDPALGRFIYTANFLGNTVSGFWLNPNDGTFVATQNTPYTTDANPTALVAVPHGNHALQTITK